MYKNMSIASKIMLPFGIGLVVTFSILYWIIVKSALSGTPNPGVIIIALVILFVIIMLGEWNISRVILKPIRQMSSYAKKLAAGDMNFKMETDRSNEMGHLAISFTEVQEAVVKILAEVKMFGDSLASGNLASRSDAGNYQGDYREIASGLNAIMEMISGLVRNVRDSASLVSDDSKEISGGAMALARGASEQASAIEEISATVESMAGYMKTTSANAVMAEHLSQDVLGEAKAGNNNMDRLMTKLNEINVSSSNISRIIKNIEDIAFQTNILALNAAVEAARAGNAGKGFAVVAAEVKNLAAKSSDAAKETNALLSDNISKARDGLDIGEQTYTSLRSIQTSIDKTTGAITQIAADARSQTETVEQINVGLSQISNIVQTNSATAEQSASSSQEMAAQAALLNEMISKYRFGNEARLSHGRALLLPAK